MIVILVFPFSLRLLYFASVTYSSALQARTAKIAATVQAARTIIPQDAKKILISKIVVIMLFVFDYDAKVRLFS